MIHFHPAQPANRPGHSAWLPLTCRSVFTYDLASGEFGTTRKVPCGPPSRSRLLPIITNIARSNARLRGRQTRPKHVAQETLQYGFEWHVRGRSARPVAVPVAVYQQTKQTNRALPSGQIGNTLNQFFHPGSGRTGFRYVLPQIPPNGFDPAAVPAADRRAFGITVTSWLAWRELV
jgi:hypothetical protein